MNYGDIIELMIYRGLERIDSADDNYYIRTLVTDILNALERQDLYIIKITDLDEVNGWLDAYGYKQTERKETQTWAEEAQELVGSGC